MAKTWWSITVELIEGRADRFWPRPGRVFAAEPSHTFAALADDTRIGIPDADWGDDDILDERTTKLSNLAPGDQLLYVFDFGDDWHHLCTIGDRKIDPLEELGIKPAKPLPYWGWGDVPDQYGRRWADDDGSDRPVPPDPRRTDLPPFFPWWGEGAAKYRD